MAGTAPGTTFGGPCHCCQPLNVLMATAWCVPQAMLDFVNAIINGYPGSCGALPTPPVLGVNDWVDAMAQARQAVMLVDFANPPAPWGPPYHPLGPEWLGPQGTLQVIEGLPIQIGNNNPPTDGECKNPVYKISTGPDVLALTPGAWFSDGFFRAFLTDAVTGPDGIHPDLAGPFACTEINYDTLHYGQGSSGVGLAQFAICDDTQIVAGPFALATRIKIVGRDHVCVSGRKNWYPGVTSSGGGGVTTASHWGPCGSQAPGPFGLIIDPPDPATVAGSTGFDFTGFGPDQGGSDTDRWEQGLGAWIGQQCKDCNCV